MKQSRLILLFFVIASISQFNFCGLERSTQGSPEQLAYRLTQESYILSEQWAILSFLGASDVTINIKTGDIAGIPPVDYVLREIQDTMKKSFNYSVKESIKNALHAMLEATDVAIFVAAVEAAHKNQQYIFYQDVDVQLANILQAQRLRIQGILDELNSRYVADEPATATSYFSWFAPAQITTQAPKHVEPLHFNANQETIKISRDMMEEIIKQNNYKIEKKSNPKHAANLLFKQCFIAQQHHLKDAERFKKFNIHFENPLKPDNYFLKHFPDIDHACSVAESIVHGQHLRNNLNDPLTLQQTQAHKLLLDIRQAIQTAMYIANDKSSYNVGYVLPASIASYLGGIVIELTAYDTKLSTLCKDPRFGATQDDMYRDEQWAIIGKIAAGTITTAMLLGGAYLYGPAFLIKGASSLASSTAGLISNLWTGKSADGKEVPGALSTLGNYGDAAVKLGTVTGLAATGLQLADKTGYVSLNNLNPNARAYVDIAQKVSGGAMIIGGSVKAVGEFDKTLAGISNAWNKPAAGTVSGKMWNGVDFVLAAKGAVTSATTATAAVTGAAAFAGASASQFLQDPNNPGVSNYQPIQNNNSSTAPQASQAATGQIPAQVLADGFTKVLAAGKAPDGTEPVNRIANMSKTLLEKGETNPATLIQVLQYVQQNNQKDPVITEQLGQLTQDVINLANKAQQ
jgi:hypothetical protein